MCCGARRPSSDRALSDPSSWRASTTRSPLRRAPPGQTGHHGLRSLLLTAAAVLLVREAAQPAAAPISAPNPAPAAGSGRVPVPVLAAVPEPLPAAGAAPLRVVVPILAAVEATATAALANPDHDAFLVIDSRTRVRSVSARATELIGLEPPDAQTCVIGELLVDAAAELADAESFPAAIARAVCAGGEAWSGFVRPRGAFGIRARVRVGDGEGPRTALVVLAHISTQRQLRPAEFALAISQEA